MDSNSPAYETSLMDELTYGFTTESRDVYKCYFISFAGYFSAYPDIASCVYSFPLNSVSGPIKHTRADHRLAITIVKIVASFLSSTVNAVVYVCDPSDVVMLPGSENSSTDMRMPGILPAKSCRLRRK